MSHYEKWSAVKSGVHPLAPMTWKARKEHSTSSRTALNSANSLRTATSSLIPQAVVSLQYPPLRERDPLGSLVYHDTNGQPLLQDLPPGGFSPNP